MDTLVLLVWRGCRQLMVHYDYVIHEDWRYLYYLYIFYLYIYGRVVYVVGLGAHYLQK